MKKRILLLILALCSLALFVSCSDTENGSEDASSQGEESNNVTSEEAIGNVDASISAELFQFTVKIDDVVYMLPAMQSAFASSGWSISEKSTETVKASFKADATLSKGDTVFDIQVINPTKAPLSFDECPVGRIAYDFSGSAEIYIADDFKLNSTTKKALTEKFGEPETTEKHSDFSEITYGSRKTSGNYANYLFRFDKNGKIIYFSMVNHYMPS
jgi:hypothetical protein